MVWSLGFNLRNDAERSVKSATIDLTPEVLFPGEYGYANLLHHQLVVHAVIKPYVAEHVTYRLSADDYQYLVDIKWQKSCWVDSVTYADGTAWRNPRAPF